MANHENDQIIQNSLCKYIWASTWNSTLKDLSMKYIEQYHKDPLWISKTNVQSLRNTLKFFFLNIIAHSILLFKLSNTSETRIIWQVLYFIVIKLFNLFTILSEYIWKIYILTTRLASP